MAEITDITQTEFNERPGAKAIAGRFLFENPLNLGAAEIRYASELYADGRLNTDTSPEGIKSQLYRV
jgi:hypothetical protein